MNIDLKWYNSDGYLVLGTGQIIVDFYLSGNTPYIKEWLKMCTITGRMHGIDQRISLTEILQPMAPVLIRFIAFNATVGSSTSRQ